MTIKVIRIILFSCLSIYSISACATTQASPVTLPSIDRLLIDSLIEKNYNTAKSLLKQGANPEAILGEKLSDHAMCSAIDDRNSKFIELLVEFGASPNAYFDVDYPLRRAPLACAVWLYNPQAFDFLLTAGANPNVNLCKECKGISSNRRTVLTAAVTANYFPFVLSLIDSYELHPQEIDHIKRSLENGPYSEAHPWNEQRNELIRWMKTQKIVFTPLPASEPINGVIDECVFSFRDMEEGLAKGTICRD